MKMNHRRMALFLFLGMLALLLAACSQGGAATPTDSGDQAVSPLPTSSAVTGPTVEAISPTPPNLTPKPDLGLARGVLYMDDQPSPGQTLYLAPVLSGGDSMKVAALDPTQDPAAETDASGTFTFVDVPPGEYALGIVAPTGLVLIRGTDDQEITVDVQAGQVADMGTIHVPSFN